MSGLSDSGFWAARARAAVTSAAVSSKAAGGSLWTWINSILSGAGHIFGTIIGKYFPLLSFSLNNLLRELHAIKDVSVRVVVWLLSGWLKKLQQQIVYVLRLALAYTDTQVGALKKQVFYAIRLVVGYINVQIAAEAKRRRRADVALDHEIKTRIRWLHQAIEREAVAAWRGANPARIDTISGVGALIVNNNPVVRALIGRIVAIVIKLAEVDNPVLRIAVGFLLRHVIARLGVDRIAGHLLDDLIGAITGHKKPDGLADVLTDLYARCQASEDQWARFMANGGSQVEQAGAEWQAITHYTTDALLLAFLGAAVVAPKAWARDVSGTLGVAANDTLSATARLLRKAG